MKMVACVLSEPGQSAGFGQRSDVTSACVTEGAVWLLCWE